MGGMVVPGLEQDFVYSYRDVLPFVQSRPSVHAEEDSPPVTLIAALDIL